MRENSLNTVISVAIVIAFWGSLLFGFTRKIVGKVAIAFFWLLKWSIVIGMAFGFMCLPQLYDVIGWTPLSLIMGSQIYTNHITKIISKRK